VDGEVEGTIELLEHRLTVGPIGKVQAGLKARECCAGRIIQENVEATERWRSARKPNSSAREDRRISIVDGAFFKRHIESVSPELAGPHGQNADGQRRPGSFAAR